MSSTQVTPSSTRSGQPRRGRVERSLLRERPDVELVEGERVLRDALPRAVLPRVPPGIEHLRPSVNAVGLPPRRRVGPDAAVLEHECIKGAVARARDLRRRTSRPRAAAAGARAPSIRTAMLLIFGAQTSKRTRAVRRERRPVLVARHVRKLRRARASGNPALRCLGAPDLGCRRDVRRVR